MHAKNVSLEISRKSRFSEAKNESNENAKTHKIEPGTILNNK